MCQFMLSKLFRIPVERLVCSSQRPQLAGAWLLLLIFVALAPMLHAAVQNEDYLAVKNYRLPADALPFEELTQVGESFTHQGAAFTGTAFEHFPSGKLQRAISYLHGKQDGLMLLWYPDGAPQMSATYKGGVLHGRFLGWYQNGGIIYDMTINHGSYTGDNLLEGDSSRESEDTETFEGEGRDNDQSPE